MEGEGGESGLSTLSPSLLSANEKENKEGLFSENPIWYSRDQEMICASLPVMCQGLRA